MLFILFYCLSIIVLSTEVPFRIVLGKLLSDKKHLIKVQRILSDVYSISEKPKILHTRKVLCFITEIKPKICLVSKYYINNLGRVPRWSKMHKLIENKFESLLLEEKQSNLN